MFGLVKNSPNLCKQKRLSQNDNTNKLDYIYLMRLKSSMGMYVKETIRVSFRHLKENNKPSSGLFCARLH